MVKIEFNKTFTRVRLVFLQEANFKITIAKYKSHVTCKHRVRLLKKILERHLLVKGNSTNSQTSSYPPIPRNFEERRLFDMENPREIQGKLRLPVDAFNFNMPADFERAAETLKFAFLKIHVDFEWQGVNSSVENTFRPRSHLSGYF